MDLDDLPVKKDDLIRTLEIEDIDALGPDELTERIERLKVLIARYEKAINDRGSSRSEAEALFS